VTDIEVVIDTSVLVKWFHADNETEVAESRVIREAHREGRLTAHILDVTPYELGNMLVGSLRWAPDRVADLLDTLLVICGPPLTPAPGWRRDAATLATEHRLSFYDASFAAAARAMGTPLISADKKLLKPALAMTATQFVEEHGDHIRKTP
jgi:predicted nucleic acid-binding protein